MSDMIQTSIAKVIDYIESNLAEPMSIEGLASVAGYSPFHFSRLFKLYTGENIASMVRRLRLAQSARQLLNKEVPVTEIGLGSGYETPSSFNKVFRQNFGCSPSQYRAKREENLKQATILLEQHPEIINAPERMVIRHRVKGEYGVAAQQAWKTLLTYMMMRHRGVVDSGQMQRFGICYDNPDITEDRQMRYEACVTVKEPISDLPDAFEIAELPAGRFARYCHEGSYASLYAISPRFYGWVLAQQEHLADFPLLERYCDDLDLVIRQQVKTPVTELYLKLQ